MSDVRDFGVLGDGRTDNSQAIQHALEQHDGTLDFPRGDYLLERTVEVRLAECGPVTIKGVGGAARLIMAGQGPALRWLGTHQGTADPKSLRPQIWERERCPQIRDLEITGTHPEADGLELRGCWQPGCLGLTIHDVRHGISVIDRHRNVIIERCHIYHNSGVGIFLDHVNLHQINIVGSHISYNQLGGIRAEGSEVRNMQITGNDIEYNNSASHAVGTSDEQDPTAEIYLSCGEKGSLREITIASNTIQATASSGGANIRLIGSPDKNHRIGMLTISGNLIGSQEANVWGTRCRGIVLSGNYIYGAEFRNVFLEDCENVAFSGNCIGANPDYQVPIRQVGVRFERCLGVNMSGDMFESMSMVDPNLISQSHRPLEALIEIHQSEGVLLAGCQLVDAIPAAIHAQASNLVTVDHCQMTNRKPSTDRRSTIYWEGPGQNNAVRNCMIQSGSEGAMVIDRDAGVLLDGNTILPIEQ